MLQISFKFAVASDSGDEMFGGKIFMDVQSLVVALYNMVPFAIFAF